MLLRETTVSRACDEGCEETYGNTHTHTHIESTVVGYSLVVVQDVTNSVEGCLKL